MSLVYEGTDIEDFIFGEGTSYDFSDVDIETGRIVECREEPEIGCYRIALESEQNFNNILMAIATQEIATFESTGVSMVYTEGSLKDIGKSIKNAILKAWEKIKGVFKRAIDWISQFIFTNKKFVERYKGKTVKVPTDKKFKGFDYSNAATDREKASEIPKLISDTINMNMTKVAGGVENIKNIEEGLRKDIVKKVGGTTSGDSSDFAADLKKALRGGKDEKYDLDLKVSDYDASINIISNGKQTKSILKKSYSSNEKMIKALVDLVDSKRRAAEKGSEAESKLKESGNAAAACIRIVSITNGAHINAIQAAVNQAKAIVLFFNANQPKEKSANESAFDFLGDVELI